MNIPHCFSSRITSKQEELVWILMSLVSLQISRWLQQKLRTWSFWIRGNAFVSYLSVYASVLGSNQALPPLSVTGQPLDGAPAVVHFLHFRFHSSSPGCLLSITLPLSLWRPADCNFSDGVGILAQHVPNPAPSLSGDDSLHILSLGPC